MRCEVSGPKVLFGLLPSEKFTMELAYGDTLLVDSVRYTRCGAKPSEVKIYKAPELQRASSSKVRANAALLAQGSGTHRAAADVGSVGVASSAPGFGEQEALAATPEADARATAVRPDGQQPEARAGQRENARRVRLRQGQRDRRQDRRVKRRRGGRCMWTNAAPHRPAGCATALDSPATLLHVHCCCEGKFCAHGHGREKVSVFAGVAAVPTILLWGHCVNLWCQNTPRAVGRTEAADLRRLGADWEILACLLFFVQQKRALSPRPPCKHSQLRCWRWRCRDAKRYASLQQRQYFLPRSRRRSQRRPRTPRP